MFSLADLLNRECALTEEGVDGFFAQSPQKFCSPGYWVSTAARARDRGLALADLNIRNDSLGFAQAIQIEAALNQPDSYKYVRRGKGGNYSPLVVLSEAADVDRATGDISGCVHTIFPDESTRLFVRDLCDVVGDLHDNVWSHGLSTGISQAYKFSKPYSRKQHSCFEFALADCGYGLLGELRRSGVSTRLGVTSDEAALAWCIEEGHSSKLPVDDPWAQRLPDDAMGNPIGPSGRVLPRGSHHQGLGLHKLVQLVKGYSGNLWMASGHAMLHIDHAGNTLYSQIAAPWKGVTLACRFDTENVVRRVEDRAMDELDDLLSQLLEEPYHEQPNFPN